MNTDFVLFEQSSNGIATITLNRPDRHNAFNEGIIATLQSLLVQVNQDSKNRIILIKAQGKHFSAGADLEWMKKMVNYTEAENLQDATALATLLNILNTITKPTIAVAQGSTFGGGVGLLACCDIVIAAQTANFCFSEVKLGLVPATISPYVIRAIGSRAAQYLFLTAKQFDALTAQRLGLVHEVVPESQLQSTAEALCRQLLANGPQALRVTKEWLARLDPGSEHALLESAELIAKVRTSAEAQEGLSAFLEKRLPVWSK